MSNIHDIYLFCGHIPDLSFSDKIEIIPLITPLAQLRPKHVAHLRPTQNINAQPEVAQLDPTAKAQLEVFNLILSLLLLSEQRLV